MSDEIKKDLKTMMDEPIKLKLLDGKEYSFSSLGFADALKLADKLSLINLVPAVSLMEEKQREALLDILELMFKYHHPEITREALKTRELLNLAHIRKIIDIGLDLNQIKK
jgi:hypothetical protein